MIRTTNVRNGYVNLETVKYVEEETYQKWTRRQTPQVGDVILTREAPLGEVGLLRDAEGVFLGQRLMSYRANEELLDRYYLLYTLMSHEVQGQIRGYGSGSTVEHMRVGDAENISIPLPPLALQRRIGAVLIAYDNLIENNTRRIKLLEQMAQLIYQEWFVDFRFPGHEGVEMVASELGLVPEGWPVVPFTKLADVKGGGTPRTTVEDYWNGEIPFFTPKDSVETFHVLTTEKSITPKGLNESSTKLYPKNTVFITARGTVGKINMPASEMAMNQSCYALTGTGNVTQPFLFLALKNQVDYLRQNTHGAVFDTIITDTFQRMMVVKPPQRLIENFTSISEPLFKQCLNLTIKNQNLRQTRDMLLPKLISGELDVSELAEVQETAEATA